MVKNFETDASAETRKKNRSGVRRGKDVAAHAMLEALLLASLENASADVLLLLLHSVHDVRGHLIEA